MFTLLKGLLLGLSIAAPVGPIGLLCIRKTLLQGRWYGFVSGLGAATADAIYGAIAALGVSVIISLMKTQGVWISGAGALFLLYLAYNTFRAPVDVQGAIESENKSFFQTYLTTFALTLMNPMTISAFVGIIAAMHIKPESGEGFLLVAGVFLGSAAWWFFLSLVFSALRKMISEKTMRWINRLSSIILLGFGIYSLVAFLLFLI